MDGEVKNLFRYATDPVILSTASWAANQASLEASDGSSIYSACNRLTSWAACSCWALVLDSTPFTSGIRRPLRNALNVSHVKFRSGCSLCRCQNSDLLGYPLWGREQVKPEGVQFPWSSGQIRGRSSQHGYHQRRVVRHASYQVLNVPQKACRQGGA